MNLGKHKGLRVGIWNVLTLYQVGKTAQLLNEMQRYNIEILGASEVRWNGCGEQTCGDGYKILHSGMPNAGDDHIRGVAIVLGKKIKNSLMEWEPISERLMRVRLNTKYRKTTLIQCYAPTEPSTLEEKEAFYALLDAALSKIPKGDLVMLMGDLNAKVGSNNIDIESIMGPHGLGVRNENGELLIDICGKHGLKIGGTMFNHKKCHKVTWVSRADGTENQIDHICISRRWSNTLLDVRSKRGADINSDHHLVVGTIRIKPTKHGGQNICARKRFDVQKLNCEDTKQKFISTLRECPILPQAGRSIEDKWVNIKNRIKQVSEETLGFVNPERKEWITSETWNKIEERRRAKEAMNAANTRSTEYASLKEQYCQLEKDVKKSTRRDRRKFMDDLGAEAQKAADLKNQRKVYSIIKKLSDAPTHNNVPIKSKDMRLLTTVQEQLNRWKEHFEEVLTEERSKNPTNSCPQRHRRPDRNINTNHPSKEEILTAIKELKNGKAPGIDGIPAEVLKADSGTMAEMLYPLFRDIWNGESFPKEWLEGVIVKIAKKGNLSECNNWRGINLLCAPSKIFNRVILNRIMSPLVQQLRKEQAGFMPGKSCIDQINTLRIIIEQSAEFNSPLYVLFIDYEKAFDKIDRSMLWILLANYGVPAKIIQLIKTQYDQFTCRVSHAGMLSDPIETICGVRQGCLLSPLLFLVVIDHVMVTVTQGKPRGIQWGLTGRLEDLDYADDQALLSHTREEMQDKLLDLTATAATVNLKINISKTKEIRFNNSNTDDLVVGDTPIERVSQFTYLGSVIAADGGATLDINARIQKARGAFARLRKVWVSKEIKRSTKLSIFNACVKSVLLYGCESWLVTEDLRSRLQTFVNKCLRFILQIFWPRVISNEDLWQITEQPQINETIRRRKYGWMGHSLRRDIAEPSHMVLSWNPQGSRTRGRPKMTWRRSVQKETGMMSTQQLRSVAKDRSRWRNFCNSL